MVYRLGLKLWSVNTDYYYEEAKRLYGEGVFDYIELYVVPNTLDTLAKWKELKYPSPLVGEGWGEGYKKATHFYSKQALEYSKELRKNLTDPEKILWHYLRNRQLNNMKFRRQEAIGDYIVDFVCYEAKLIIELDGGGHLEEEQKKHDLKRDKFLAKNGFKVLRVFNNEVFENIVGVIDCILYNSLHQQVDKQPLTPTLSHKGRGSEGIPFIIHAPHFAHGFNLALKEKRESNFEIYKEVKQFADELNAEYIIFHGGIEGDIEETARQLASFNDSRALIENKPLMGLPGELGSLPCRGFNIEEIKTVIKEANCGFCFDFGHCICSANAQKIEPYSYCEEFIRELNPSMYHLTDFKDITSIYDSHLHLGTGELDLKKIISMIEFGKKVTLETIKNSKKNIDDFCDDITKFREQEG